MCGHLVVNQIDSDDPSWVRCYCTCNSFLDLNPNLLHSNLPMFITALVTHSLTMSGCDLVKPPCQNKSKSRVNHSLICGTGTRSKYVLCDFSPAGSRGEAQAERAAEDSKTAGRGFTHAPPPPSPHTNAYNPHDTTSQKKPYISTCPALAAYSLIMLVVISGTSFLLSVCFGGIRTQQTSEFLFGVCMCSCTFWDFSLYIKIKITRVFNTVFRLY